MLERMGSMANQGLSIAIQNIDSPLGKMVVGSTEKGICYLTWLDEDGMVTVEREIRKRYGVPTLLDGNPYNTQLVKELGEYFSGNRRQFETPLDTRGTEFEKKVWRHLTEIPYGRTKSYGQVATTIGNPKGSRAVGGANGANPVVIVVPCHRVIGADGSLHGFGCGLWRKKWLLELESGMIPDPVSLKRN
jgi:AraC family transcriptional regulator, regulatory protein of adaptative response / methylated-DNA-[protein]-cysteine methyltransferase